MRKPGFMGLLAEESTTFRTTLSRTGAPRRSLSIFLINLSPMLICRAFPDDFQTARQPPWIIASSLPRFFSQLWLREMNLPELSTSSLVRSGFFNSSITEEAKPSSSPLTSTHPSQPFKPCTASGLATTGTPEAMASRTLFCPPPGYPEGRDENAGLLEVRPRVRHVACHNDGRVLSQRGLEAPGRGRADHAGCCARESGRE